MGPDTSEIIRSLGRIEGKLESLIATQVDLRTDHNNLRGELDKVKTKLHWYSGGVAAFVVILSTFKEKIMGVFA